MLANSKLYTGDSKYLIIQEVSQTLTGMSSFGCRMWALFQILSHTKKSKMICLDIPIFLYSSHIIVLRIYE